MSILNQVEVRGGHRRRRIGPSLAVLGLLMSAAGHPGDAMAGAWTRDPGGFYSRISLNRYHSDSEFDDNGERQPLPFEGEFTDLNVAGYFEYGVLDRLTATTSFAIKSLRSENLVRIIESKGIGDIDLALRARLAAGSAGVASVQLLAKIPAAYEEDVDLPLGNGEREYETRVLYGRSMWPLLPGYCGVELGYRWRLGEPDDQLRYLLELGSNLGPDFYFRSKLDGTRGRMRGGSVDINGNPTIRNSYDLGNLDVTAGRRFGANLSIEAEWTEALYGRTTSSGTTLTLALAYTGSFGRHDSPADQPQKEPTQ